MSHKERNYISKAVLVKLLEVIIKTFRYSCYIFLSRTYGSFANYSPATHRPRHTLMEYATTYAPRILAFM